VPPDQVETRTGQVGGDSERERYPHAADVISPEGIQYLRPVHRPGLVDHNQGYQGQECEYRNPLEDDQRLFSHVSCMWWTGMTRERGEYSIDLP